MGFKILYLYSFYSCYFALWKIWAFEMKIFFVQKSCVCMLFGSLQLILLKINCSQYAWRATCGCSLLNFCFIFYLKILFSLYGLLLENDKQQNESFWLLSTWYRYLETLDIHKRYNETCGDCVTACNNISIYLSSVQVIMLDCNV